MPEIIHGEPTVQQPTERSGDPSSGTSTTLRHVGITEHLVGLVYAQGYNRYPYSITPRGDGPVAELTVEMGSAEATADPTVPLVVEWGFESSSLERSLWEHPKVSDALKTASNNDLTNGTNDVGVLRKWVADQVSGKVQTFSPALFSNTDIKTMCSLLIAGVEAFIIPKLVVTMTAKLTPESSVWMPFANVGDIFTKAGLTGIGAPYTPPAAFADKLPVGEYMTMSARHTTSSEGDRMVEYQFDFADKWDSWIYPHAP